MKNEAFNKSSILQKIKKALMKDKDNSYKRHIEDDDFGDVYYSYSIVQYDRNDTEIPRTRIEGKIPPYDNDFTGRFEYDQHFMWPKWDTNGVKIVRIFWSKTARNVKAESRKRGDSPWSSTLVYEIKDGKKIA